MLQERKPKIPWDGPGGLEEMFSCLFQCEQEGDVPPENHKTFVRLRDKKVFADEHIQEHRAPLVRAVLADKRLKGCLGYVSLKATEGMPYSELRLRAVYLKEQILKWMNGRVFDPREQKKRGKGGVKRYVVSKPLPKEPDGSPYGIPRHELFRMKEKMESFLSYGEDADYKQQTLQLLCYDVDAILSDPRFRKATWAVKPNASPYNVLRENAATARVTFGIMLEQTK